MDNKAKKSKPPSLKIYLDEQTAHSRALLIFFTKAKAKARRVNVDLKNNKGFTEEYTTAFPNKDIPGMRDGRLVITDTIEIMKHVCEKYLSPFCKLYPRINIMEIYEIEKLIRKYNFLVDARISKIYIKLKKPFSQFTASGLVHFTLEEISLVNVFLSEFDKFFVKEKNGNFFLVDKGIFTIIDILILCDIVQFTIFGIDLVNFKKISGWLKTCFKDEVVVRAHTKFLIWAAKVGKISAFKFN